MHRHNQLPPIGCGAPADDECGPAALEFLHPQTAEHLALVLAGAAYTGSFEHTAQGSTRTLHGRGVQLRVGPPASAATFVMSGGGTTGNVQIRGAHDDLMGLDVSHGKMEADNPVNLWGTVEEPTWAQTYTLAGDGTIGPAKLPHVPAACARFCLGIEAGKASGSKVVLVDRSDTRRRIVFLGRVARLGAAAEAEAAKVCVDKGY